MKIYFRIFAYLKPYRLTFLFALALTLIFTAANVLFLPLVRDIMEEISHQNFANFLNHVINAVVLYACREFSKHGQGYVMTLISHKIAIDIRVELYERYQSFTQYVFTEWKLGDLMTRLFGDVDHVRDAVVDGYWELLPQILTFVGIVSYMLWMNWMLTLFTLVAIPLFVVLIGVASERLKKVMRQVMRKNADLTHIVQETLMNVKLVQSYTMESYEVDRFEKECMRNYKASMKGVRVRHTVDPTISFMQFLVIALVLLAGGFMVSKGLMKGAELASFFTGVMLLIDPVIALSKVYTKLQQSLVSAHRLFKMLDWPIEILSPEEPKSVLPMRGQVSLENVSFYYKSNKSLKVLDEVSLDVNPGEVIALVGLSGAGKTTLINLLPRFYDVTGGSIKIDGVDLRDWDLHELRSQMGIVAQESIIFRGSVRNNIKYGSPDATDEEIIEAAKKANAWEFIQEMRSKLNARVGDRGQKLSGGQRQRISIARAILRDPKLLILDEATSSLDSKSEKLVQDALETLMKDRTTFVIAHRLSTIMHADKIVVLEKGKIAEIGTHQELLDKQGVYSKFYHIQFKKRESES